MVYHGSPFLAQQVWTGALRTLLRAGVSKSPRGIQKIAKLLASQEKRSRGGVLRHVVAKINMVRGSPNSIAFGSAPRREVGNQLISPLARPAGSQTEAHSLGFLSVADAAPSTGETFRLRPSSGRMVMQLTGVFLVGSSNPGRVNTAPPPPPPPPTVGQPGFEPPTENFASAALPFDRRLCESDKLPHCLEPSEQKLLTPPPPPTPVKKVISSFRGWRPRNQKIHWGMVLLGKIMILQGVGHPISCLGVCYENDPKKGGVYDARACA